MPARRHVPVSELEDYLDCGIHYRFRHVFHFPERGGEAEDILVSVTGRMVSSWLGHLAKGHGKKAARTKALRTLMKTWYRIGGTDAEFPRVHMYVVAVLQTVASYFDPETDTPVGGRTKTVLPVDEVTVCDRTDGVFVKDDRGPRSDRKRMVVIQVRGDEERKTGPRLGSLRPILARWTACTATRGMRMSASLLTIRVPSLAKEWEEIPDHDYRDSRYLVRSVTRAMRNRVFLPTTDRTRCDACWYRPVCTNTFTLPAVDPVSIERARREIDRRTREHDAGLDREL